MSRVVTENPGMIEYPKIETLFERDKKTFVVNPDLLKSPVLATIKEWDVTEKIDGTNIRVALTPEGRVVYGGRTAAAQLPADLFQVLTGKFTENKLRELWIDDTRPEIILFGEGYGPGIQKGGGLYRADKSFILFDVLVDGRWWLDRETVNGIAEKLEIDTVPYLGRMTLPEIVDLVRHPFPSKIGTAVAEGVVARPIETLFDRRMERVIIKLKTRDFVQGRR